MSDYIVDGSLRTARSRALRQAKRRRTDGRQALMRRRNMERLIKSAEAVFAKRGFDGATTAEIARKAGVSKATLHYYFPTKKDIYTHVLDRILGIWVNALDEINAETAPAEALTRYIARKVQYSREYPEDTRLWAMAVLSGGQYVRSFLRNRVKPVVDSKNKVIRQWIAAGKMDPIDPTHLLFLIWASTQTYAECEYQIEAILGTDGLTDQIFSTATRTATNIFLKGLGVAR
jgi:TetR/AcrR family transcriptional regulator